MVRLETNKSCCVTEWLLVEVRLSVGTRYVESAGGVVYDGLVPSLDFTIMTFNGVDAAYSLSATYNDLDAMIRVLIQRAKKDDALRDLIKGLADVNDKSNIVLRIDSTVPGKYHEAIEEILPAVINEINAK